MKIAFAGCSHSTPMYGKSWAVHLIEDLKCDFIEISVSGGSNELLVEKIKVILDKNPEVDFYFMQLTDPSRLTLGVYGNDALRESKLYGFNYEGLKNHLGYERETNNISYLTIKMNQNDNDIKNVINKDYKVADFFNNHILISDYNTKIKIFHTLLTLNSLFNFYNKKCLFFSWAVDVIELSKEVGYYDIIKELNIVPDSILNFVKKNKLEKYLVDSTHYSTEAHKIFYDDFLKKHVYKFINKDL